MLARFEFGLLVFLIGSLTLILSAQVILRYFFSDPLFWAEDVSVQILISATFIGLSHLTYSNSLVRVDFIIDNLPDLYQQWLVYLLRLVGLGTLVVLCYHATEWILRPEIKADIAPTTGLPRWYNYLVVVVTFYCMSWHQLVKLLTQRPHSSLKNTGVRPAGMSVNGGGQ